MSMRTLTDAHCTSGIEFKYNYIETGYYLYHAELEISGSDKRISKSLCDPETLYTIYESTLNAIPSVWGILPCYKREVPKKYTI